jgi:hypothetical protein
MEILERANLIVLVYTDKGGTPPFLEAFQMFALDDFDDGYQTGYCRGGYLCIGGCSRRRESVEG